MDFVLLTASENAVCCVIERPAENALSRDRQGHLANRPTGSSHQQNLQVTLKLLRRAANSLANNQEPVQVYCYYHLVYTGILAAWPA